VWAAPIDLYMGTRRSATVPPVMTMPKHIAFCEEVAERSYYSYALDGGLSQKSLSRRIFLD
jgi:hypothetical protein